MEPQYKSHSQETRENKPLQKLMVSGFIGPGGVDHPLVEVRRGMAIRTNDGLEAGKVAAVVLNGETRQPVNILLGRLPQLQEYRILPLNVVTGIEKDTVLLRISYQDVEKLPIWDSK